MTTGPSTKPLSEKLAERRAQQLAEMDSVTQTQLSEHENALRQQLAAARHTTESAINDLNHSLSKQLNSVVTGQREQIEQIEKRLATAVAQAERLSRAGGLRNWTRPAAITVAVMLAVGGMTAGGLAIADRLIDSRLQQLATLRQEIQRAESMPRLGDHLEIRTIQGATYLVGEAWIGNMEDDGTQVVELTNTRN
ncbi:hypothetical protein HaloA020_36640 (plasmid) [Halomonas sp. A020]|uniref:hypothetical protein n=1 Tax=Halomonas sp. A020 TaxID=2717374 RepID=UPI002491B846|nr:hypothetical protein [Halomonas sp. A020]BCB62963.1 hypothetical protein HaloA020_36640 [Halomonas sp. A020]